MAREGRTASKPRGVARPKATTGPGPSVSSPQQVRSQRAPSGGSQLMPEALSTPLEHRIGHSFADVRIHADGASASRTAAAGAAAMTIGRDIYFGAGRYRPETPQGQRLLAHELVHVAQWQRGGRPKHAAPLLPVKRKRLEAEAGQASERVIAGGRASGLSALNCTTPLLHPVYISQHGTQGFLDNAFDFFSDWGYSPIVRGVNSIQQIVADLATRSALGRVTIVSHAHPTNIMMALLNGGRAHLEKDDMSALTVPRTGVIPQSQPQSPASSPPAAAPPAMITVPGILPATPTARTVQNFDALVGRESDQTHLLPLTQLNSLIGAIAADKPAATRLARIGSPTDGIVRQYLWWTLDSLFIPKGGFAGDRTTRLQTISDRAREAYRGTIQVAAAAAPAAIFARDFTNLDAEIQRLTAQWPWPAPADAAAKQAAEQRVASSPYAIVNAILWNPNFLPEIAGADQRVLEMVRRLPQLEDHYLVQSTLNNVITALSSSVLQPIGGSTDLLVRQWAWWVIEGAYPANRGFAPGTRARVEAAARIRRQAYRDLIIAAVQANGGQVPGQAVFDTAAVLVRAKFASFTYTSAAPAAAEQGQIARQLERSTQVTNATGDPTFLRQLEIVRAAITSNTWFEIQGCRAGQDINYLETFRDMFANSRARPKVSAPDWFQAFGHYGWRPSTAAQIPGQWAQQAVQDAFTYWYPILTGNAAIAAPTHQDLLAFLQTPMMLPLSSPGNTAQNTLLVLNNVREDALLAWLGQHGYRITRIQDIRQALFLSQNFGTNIRTSTVDWLSEQRQGGEVRFRPDPDYLTHIKTVT